MFWWSSFRKSYSICLKILIWRNLVHLRPFFGQNWQFWEFFTYNFQNAAMNLPSFLYGSCSYGVLWENHTLYAWKILIWRNFGHLRRKFGHFWPSCFWCYWFPVCFCSIIRFSDIFFETAHQIWLKLGHKLGTITLNQRMAVLCLGKFLFWLFKPFLGQKYIACGDIIWFWAVFGHFLPNCWSYFVNFCYLS